MSAAQPSAAVGAAAAGQLDEDEAFYEANRAELLEALRAPGWHHHLQPRGDSGVGLMNQGATCYMNSLLQALYHTPDFRQAVYRWRYDAELHGEAERSIPLQLQRLFARLQLSCAAAVSTRDLTAACGFTARDSLEQHDVQELCRVLFDALERSSSSLAQEIDRLYAGRARHYIRCREAPEGLPAGEPVPQSRREERLLDLQVPIAGHASLEDALKALIEPEELTGDNQWFCEELGRKVDALKGVEYLKLPTVLCIQLLRFVFDCFTMQRRKLTDALIVPLEVDLSFMLGSQEPAVYELSAVCLHSGTAHGGHYHVFLRDGDTWLDANDSTVRKFGEEQVQRLFGPADGSGKRDVLAAVTDFLGEFESKDLSQNAKDLAREMAALLAEQSPPPPPPEKQQEQRRALSSTDAYFLVYRRRQPSQDSDGTAPAEETVPEPLRSEILAENERLHRLQRAHQLHQKLLEVRVYAPNISYSRLRLWFVQMIPGLVSEKDSAEAEAAFCGEAFHVVLNIHEAHPVGRVLRQALELFRSKATKQTEDNSHRWSWAQQLLADGVSAVAASARLREIDWCTGELKTPLPGATGIAEALQCRAGCTAQHVALEVPPVGGSFDAWDESIASTTAPAMVCRWDAAQGAIGLSPDSLRIVRVPLPQPQEPQEPKPEAPKAPATTAQAAEQPAEPVEPTEPTVTSAEANEEKNVDKEAPPSLFEGLNWEPEEYRLDWSTPAVNKKATAVQSIAVGSLRAAVLSAFGVEDLAGAALVALTGRRAGEALQLDEDAKTLSEAAVALSDGFCVEILPPSSEDGSALQSVALYEKVHNTANLTFNHPDRPEQYEEYQLSISKDAPLHELKERIGSVIGLPATALHLCRNSKAPQIKDEKKSLRAAGLAESSSVFVGHGAPLGEDEFLLKISHYHANDKAGWKATEAFSHPAQATGSVRSLRQALLEPLKRWAEQVTATEGKAPFTQELEELTWRRLRLRDGQAGKQWAILRDERTLRSALSGMSDGRQVAIQILDRDEELKTSDLILFVRPWRVAEGRLHAPSETIVSRDQTLAELRDSLHARFRGLLGRPSPEAEAPPTDVEDDHLELVCLGAGPPLGVRRCITLPWADSPLNATEAEELAKPLSEFREVRDGATLVIRSYLQGQGEPAEAQPAVPKVKPAPKRAATKAKAQSGGVTVAQGPARRERALVIDVAKPELPPVEPPLSAAAAGVEPTGGEAASADAAANEGPPSS